MAVVHVRSESLRALPKNVINNIKETCFKFYQVIQIIACNEAIKQGNQWNNIEHQ